MVKRNRYANPLGWVPFRLHHRVLQDGLLRLALPESRGPLVVWVEGDEHSPDRDEERLGENQVGPRFRRPDQEFALMGVALVRSVGGIELVFTLCLVIFA